MHSSTLIYFISLLPAVLAGPVSASKSCDTGFERIDDGDGTILWYRDMDCQWSGCQPDEWYQKAPLVDANGRSLFSRLSSSTSATYCISQKQGNTLQYLDTMTNGGKTDKSISPFGQCCASFGGRCKNAGDSDSLWCKYSDQAAVVQEPKAADRTTIEGKNKFYTSALCTSEKEVCTNLRQFLIAELTLELGF
ncbi:hypothetical protein PT974_03013 [Cladobotryum mycophilum]|uniref:Uncharacterized protein n=1 Tax=Cladobotryum mycophilum TaxID=491253 RepID=A0ABR0SW65_9HYPO